MALHETWKEWVWKREDGKYFASPSPFGDPKKEISYQDFALKKLSGAEELPEYVTASSSTFQTWDGF